MIGIRGILTRSGRSDRAGREERLASPEVVQRGRAVRHQAAGDGVVRRARVKTTPGAVDYVTCNLGSETGEEITAYCDICNGTALNDASPLLAAGMYISVYREGGVWRCAAPFQGYEECVCNKP